jgi:lipopolysaccharide transport system permease protein
MRSQDNVDHLARGGLKELVNPVRFARDLIEGLTFIRKNRRLAAAMMMRELRSRYAGQFTGAFWIVGHPLFQMLIFVFIFGIVFKQRLGGSYELPRDYTTYILSGLVPWLTFSSSLPTVCMSVIANSNLVKQFTFPTEVLPIKDIFISMIFWIVGFAIVSAYGIFVNGSLPWTYALVPVVLVLNLMLSIGIAWIMSSISVFVRDLKEITTIVVSAGIYALPVVYLPSQLPRVFRPFIAANPFSAMIWVYQDTLYFGRIEHPWAWVAFSLMAVICFAFGFRLFQLLKPFFGKAL